MSYTEQKDFLQRDMITINGFDSGIYDSRLMNMEAELAMVDINASLNIQAVDGKYRVFSGDTKITLEFRNKSVVPSMAGIYLRGLNKRSVFYKLVKYCDGERLPSDRYETYFIMLNDVKYEIGFNMDNAGSYMKLYDEKKWEKLYYGMNHNEKSRHIFTSHKVNPVNDEIYGDSGTSLGSIYIDNAMEEVLQAIEVLNAYKAIPEVNQIIELMLDIDQIRLQHH